MLQKHIAVAAVRQRRRPQVLHQASVAQKASFRRKQVAALQVQAVHRRQQVFLQILMLLRLRILMSKQTLDFHLELLHHLVQVALSQVALAARQIIKVPARRAYHNQVVASKGSLAQSVTSPTTTSTTKSKR
jgi:hypothetical protein